jgi:hypothetical protein
MEETEMSLATTDFTTRTYYFEPEMIRLMLVEFRRYADRVGGGTLADKMERQLCDEPGRCLDEETFAIFSKWCHTDGAYKGAMHVAQAISLMIYGRIIARVTPEEMRILKIDQKLRIDRELREAAALTQSEQADSVSIEPTL